MLRGVIQLRGVTGTFKAATWTIWGKSENLKWDISIFVSHNSMFSMFVCSMILLSLQGFISIRQDHRITST